MIDRLEEAKRLPDNRSNVRQIAIGQSLRLLNEAGVVDPGWPKNVPQPVESPKHYPEISLEQEL